MEFAAVVVVLAGIVVPVHRIYPVTLLEAVILSRIKLKLLRNAVLAFLLPVLVLSTGSSSMPMLAVTLGMFFFGAKMLLLFDALDMLALLFEPGPLSTGILMTFSTRSRLSMA